MHGLTKLAIYPSPVEFEVMATPSRRRLFVKRLIPMSTGEIHGQSFHEAPMMRLESSSLGRRAPPPRPVRIGNVSPARRRARLGRESGGLGLLGVLCAVVSLLAAGCGSAVTVKAAYDPAAPFAQYRTFAMIEPNRPVPTGMDSDPFTLRQLRELTYRALVQHGLRPVPEDQADLVVGVLARFQQQVDISSGPYMGPYDYGYYGYGPRYGGPWAGFSQVYGPTVTKYDEMQVAIDLVDPKKNEVRWRGYGARRADRQLDRAELEEVVQRILSQYPPGGRASDGQ